MPKDMSGGYVWWNENPAYQGMKIPPIPGMPKIPPIPGMPKIPPIPGLPNMNSNSTNITDDLGEKICYKGTGILDLILYTVLFF